MSVAPTTAPQQKAARVAPAPTIRFDGGAFAGQAIRLDADGSTLGRSPDDAYVLADPQVSRLHARLEMRAGTVIVTDLGSSGGTTVNGQEIDGPHSLHHGDTIALSGIEGRFEDPAAAAEELHAAQVFELPTTIDTGRALSPRQQQVLEHIAQGMTNKEIGGELGITERQGVRFTQEPLEMGGVTTAVFDDTCGNLIQIANAD